VSLFAARSPGGLRLLAGVLALVGGAVNAIGFLALGQHTSHMSGAVARVAEELAQRHLAAAGTALLLVASFVLGAMTSTVLLAPTQTPAGARYTRPLLLEATAVGVVAFGGLVGWRGEALLPLLSFSMGMQNALIPPLAGTVIRTTHLTGVLTDLGVGAVRYLRRPADPDLRQRLALHLTLLLAFLAGATLGALGFLAGGFSALAVPALALLAVALFDALRPR
ncbi:MAG: YoaK family protein, partial [Myxococcales bacterium]